MKYFFILGNHPKLSLAELIRVLKVKKFKADHHWSVFNLKAQDLNFEHQMQNRLGGTIKIGQVFKSCSKKELESAVLKLLINNLEISQKIFFGFSAYEVSELNIKKISLNIKRKLKKQGIKSRWVDSRAGKLSSVVVKTNKLLSERGAEIVLMPRADKILIGRTSTVQPFAKLSKRDYGRPVRNPHSGMLPPKLARMMLNLGVLDLESSVLDPFCGSGTVLSEALLLGCKKIIGIDKSQSAILATRKNLAWLDKNYQADLFCHDVRSLSQKIKPGSISAIVTEPFLGPPLTGKESDSKIKEIILKLEDLYLKSFQQFTNILKPKAKVVIVFPRIFEHKIEILDQIKGLGFDFDKKIQDLYNDKKRHSFLYSRKGQKLKREIFVYEFS